MKIAYDVPDKLIDLVNSVDYSAISAQQQKEFLQQLENLANKYLSKKCYTDYETKSATIQAPKSLIDLINSYDFNQLSKLEINIAFPVIRNFVYKNLPVIK